MLFNLGLTGCLIATKQKQQQKQTKKTCWYFQKRSCLCNNTQTASRVRTFDYLFFLVLLFQHEVKHIHRIWSCSYYCYSSINTPINTDTQVFLFRRLSFSWHLTHSLHFFLLLRCTGSKLLHFHYDTLTNA